MGKILSNDGMTLNNVYIIRMVPILISIFLVGNIVYATGGTEAALTHLMYIPIILAAFYAEIAGAVIAAVLGGLVLGPFMPKDTASGLMQEPAGWFFRLMIFVIIGVTVALLFRHVRSYQKKEEDQFYVNILTGLPNMNKLKRDLEELVDRKTPFSLIGFKIVNLSDINRYVGYEVGSEAVKLATEQLGRHMNGTVYTLYTNEFAVILPTGSAEGARAMGIEFLRMMRAPHRIGQFSVELILKGGLVNFPQQAEDADSLIRKMGIALDQKTDEIGFYVYNAMVDQKRKERAKLVNALLSAVKDEEFYLVYQPQKRLEDGGLAGAEALLRWDCGGKGPVNTGEFIQLAEEIGIIGQITKWVIKNVTEQMKRWEEEGVRMKVALNISPKDLKNRSVIDYLIHSIEEKALDPSSIEVELTERGILEDKESATQCSKILRNHGIKLALDDFGTGYNTLIDLVEIPIDYLKIDKIFVDNIFDDMGRTLIEYTIGFAKKTGKKVVAEGVETREQMDILKELGCDFIQGYYYSKPVPPDEIKRMCGQTVES